MGLLHDAGSGAAVAVAQGLLAQVEQLVQAAVDLLGLATERLSGGVTSFEAMIRDGIEAVVKFDSKSRDPLASPHPWYVLIEVSSQQRTGLRDVLEEILAAGHEKGLVLDAPIADSIEQAKAFWRIRFSAIAMRMSPAAGGRSPASPYEICLSPLPPAPRPPAPSTCTLYKPATSASQLCSANSGSATIAINLFSQ
ncbi:hypothetical protein B4Q13_15610 [Lacticaseibacillus rhamnosus]